MFRKFIPTKISKLAEVQCDECQAIFTTRWKHHVRKFHFCNKKCQTQSQVNGVLKIAKEETFMKNYGCKNPSQADSIKQKKIQTARENFGYDSHMQSPEFMANLKIKNLEEKGYEFARSSPKAQEKRIKTNLIRYNHVCAFHGSSKEKSEQTNLKKYGAVHHMKTELGRSGLVQSFLSKHGVENPQQIPEVIEKTQQTVFDKYGVTCVFQTPENIAKQRQAMKDNSEKYSSEAENEFYKCLLTKWSADDIIRWYWIEKPDFTWCIDFYIKSIQTFVQFDGVWFHGLDKPIEEIRQSESNWDRNRAAAYDKDRLQDEWFSSRGKRLIRVTDVEFKDLGKTVLEKIHKSL